MSEVQGLLDAFVGFVRLPWPERLAAQQRVWCAVYDPADERRLRLRLGDFEHATRQAGHGWLHLDLTPAFAEWLGTQKYRDAYFEEPDDLELALDGFKSFLQAKIVALQKDAGTGPQDVVALSGVGSLFGLISASKLIEAVAPQVPGRLLVFFPGRYENANYRLLDARDGWNYHAIPITAGGNTL